MSIIEVGKIGVSITDPINSVKITHQYFNAGEKEIKYLTFSYVPYNAVNDVVACTASNKSLVSAKITGPIAPKSTSHVTWESLWFNPTVTSVAITQIHIQYMDNSEDVIEGKDIVFTTDLNSLYYKEVFLPAKMQQLELSKKVAEAKRIEEEKAVIQEAKRVFSTVYQIRESANSACANAFFKLRDPEKLLKVLEGIEPHFTIGYTLGDLIETKYSNNEELMNKAVAYWKSSIDIQQKNYKTPIAKQYNEYPEKYAEKIKKYDPTYVMPKKAGCMSK